MVEEDKSFTKSSIQETCKWEHFSSSRLENAFQNNELGLQTRSASYLPEYKEAFFGRLLDLFNWPFVSLHEWGREERGERQRTVLSFSIWWFLYFRAAQKHWLQHLFSPTNAKQKSYEIKFKRLMFYSFTFLILSNLRHLFHSPIFLWFQICGIFEESVPVLMGSFSACCIAFRCSKEEKYPLVRSNTALGTAALNNHMKIHTWPTHFLIQLVHFCLTKF